MTNLAKELEYLRTYPLKSLYISLGRDQRVWGSKFCLAVSDVYFDLEFDTASFQMTILSLMQMRTISSGQETHCDSNPSVLTPNLRLFSPQGRFFNVLDPSQSDTELSKAVSCQWPGSMQAPQSDDVSENASSVIKFHAAVSQQADVRRIPASMLQLLESNF